MVVGDDGRTGDMQHRPRVSEIDAAAEEPGSAGVVGDVPAGDIDVAAGVDTVVVDRIDACAVRMDRAARPLGRAVGDRAAGHDHGAVVAADRPALAGLRLVFAVQYRGAGIHREYGARLDVDDRVFVSGVGAQIRILDRRSVHKNHARDIRNPSDNLLRRQIEHVLDLPHIVAVVSDVRHDQRSAGVDRRTERDAFVEDGEMVPVLALYGYPLADNHIGIYGDIVLEFKDIAVARPVNRFSETVFLGFDAVAAPAGNRPRPRRSL